LKQIIYTFIAVFVALILFSFVFFDGVWALNSATAYISTTLVAALSFLGYYKGIAKDGTEPVDSAEDDKYEYDQFYGDKYGVLDGDIIDENGGEAQQKEEKTKRFSIQNLLMGSKIFFSLYRVSAYLILVIALLYLIDSEMFNPWGYITGVVANTFAIILIALKLRSSNL